MKASLGSRTIGRGRYRIIGTRFCECGCGSVVSLTTKNPRQRFLTADHIPAAFRSARGRKGREVGARKRLENVFGRLLNRAIEGRQRVKRSDLLLVLQEVYRMGYLKQHNERWRVRQRSRVA